MFTVITNHLPLLLHGFGVTLLLLGSIMLIGIPLGICTGVAAGRFVPELTTVLRRAQFMTKVVPVVVLLFWLHYPAQAILGIVVPPFWTAVVALSIVNTITIANNVLRELELLPATYREAGFTLGMSERSIIRYIELPLLLRRVLPHILLTQAAMLEYTLLASLISVPELFRNAQTLNAMIYQPIAIYSLLVVFFAALLAPMHLLAQKFERKYSKYYAAV